MKKLLLLLLILSACSKPQSTTYTFYQGNNSASPLQIITPHLSGNSLTYTFMLTGDWSYFCDHPWGMKTAAIGGSGLNTDYRSQGMNFGIMATETGGLTIHARYYIDYVLYVFPEIPIQKEVWYNCKIQTDPMRWWINGVLVATVNKTIKHAYTTPIYIGGEGKATANKDLTIHFR